MENNEKHMEILRKEMKLNGFTSAQLAKRLNKDPSAIAAWLSGLYIPNPDDIKILKELKFTDTACLNPSKLVEV